MQWVACGTARSRSRRNLLTAKLADAVTALFQAPPRVVQLDQPLLDEVPQLDAGAALRGILGGSYQPFEVTTVHDWSFRGVIAAQMVDQGDQLRLSRVQRLCWLERGCHGVTLLVEICDDAGPICTRYQSLAPRSDIAPPALVDRSSSTNAAARSSTVTHPRLRYALDPIAGAQPAYRCIGV